MSFLKHRKSQRGSRPVNGSKSGSSSNNNSTTSSNNHSSSNSTTNTTVVSSNGRVVNPFQDSKQQQKQQQQPGPVTVPHSDSDLNSRKMVVLQEYRPVDNRGLAVRRGEMVQVISEELNWFYVRNERNKEGYVPSNHLMAPYSSMRSRTRGLGVPNPPIRHVASSGSTVDIKDQGHHNVSMYPSTSAGRPRNFSVGDENRININAGVSTSTSNVVGSVAPPPPPPMRRGYSPREYNSNSLPQGQSGLSVYDQKYSPSTSSASGAASFMGTSSPMGHSDGSNHSSFCSIEENVVGGGATVEEGGVVPPNQQNGVINGNDDNIMGRGGGGEGAYPKQNGTTVRPPPHPSHAGGPIVNTSGANKTPPPPPQPMQDHSGGSGDVPPPPLPPRSLYYNQQQAPPPQQQQPHPSHLLPGSEQYPYPPDEYQQGVEVDSYASPADALPRQQQPSPQLGHPRVASLNDVRLYEKKQQRRKDGKKDTGVYSEVYRGNQRPPVRQQNGYRLADDDSHSEDSSVRSRSSRKSGSRRGIVGQNADQYGGGYYDSDVFPAHESDPVTGRPLSANSPNAPGQTVIKKFRKNLWGVYIVTQGFESCDENEVSVKEGEHVSVWNQDDRDWYWIVKHDTSEEGFVPSCHLKELVNPEAVQPQVQEPTQQSHISEQPPEDSKPPPPLPPKPPQSRPPSTNSTRPPHPQYHHQQPVRAGYDNHTPSFRPRAATHDTRRSPLTPRNVNSGFRMRLSSDGSGHSSGGLRGPPSSSTASVERHERSVSPPNTPPPPYTEFDSNYHPHNHPPPPQPQQAHYQGTGAASSRHFSLSQQVESLPSAYSSTHMQRTRSHGQVPYRRVNIPRTTVTGAGQEVGGGAGQGTVPRRVLEGAGQRASSPMQDYPPGPMTVKSPMEPHPPAQRFLPPQGEGTLV